MSSLRLPALHLPTLAPRTARMLALASLAAALGFAVLECLLASQVDINVYLMGGSHAASAGLYALEYGQTRLYFTYPPFAAIFFVPLAQLPRESARLIWTLLNVAALLWLTYVTIRAIRPEMEPNRLRWWTALLAAPMITLDPLFLSFDLGQVNLVLAALVVTDFTDSSGRIPKGVLTGIAAGLKLTPLIFVPYLFLTGSRRAAGWATATFVACAAAGFGVSPHSSWQFWTTDVFQSSRVGGLLSISDQNLRSGAMRIAHGTIPNIILWPLTIAILCLGLGLAIWAHRSSSPTLGLVVCATTGLIISPVTWDHHLVWVVPALIWMAAAPDRPRHGRAVAVAAAVFFWAHPIWWVPETDRYLPTKLWEVVVGDAYLWAMLAFLVGVAVLLSRRRRLGLRTPRQAGVPAGV
ncbi:MAG: glycosyltransferase 87 family protein [Acidimicrobiales bacterium]